MDLLWEPALEGREMTTEAAKDILNTVAKVGERVALILVRLHLFTRPGA